jgi:hypothetical protein
MSVAAENGLRRPPVCASGLGVAGVMNFDAGGKETLAASLPAAGEDGTSAFGLHSCAETKLPFSGAL